MSDSINQRDYYLQSNALSNTLKSKTLFSVNVGVVTRWIRDVLTIVLLCKLISILPKITIG